MKFLKAHNSYRFQMVLFIGFCFLPLVMGQTQKPDTCQVAEQRKAPQKNVLSEAEKREAQKHEAMRDSNKKQNKDIDLERILLFKPQIINKI
ncbi:hypothetical protein [Carboxylicivirga taeanensis]|uniref:hypothetical protein n=1 Tax=Carboxylicivirga taeanensis TaxID=1416875 RepID=UPI003F6DD350